MFSYEKRFRKRIKDENASINLDSPAHDARCRMIAFKGMWRAPATRK